MEKHLCTITRKIVNYLYVSQMTFQAEAHIKIYLAKYTTGRSYQYYWVTNTAGADTDMYNSVQKDQ